MTRVQWLLFFFTKILQKVQDEIPHVSKVDIWTDGPSSQFKNKYMIFFR